MSGRNTVLWVSLVAVAMLAALAVTKAQTGGNSDAVAAVTKLENESVKADLANDKAFFEKYFADDWTGGDSGGTWFTKADVLKLMNDPEHNKTNSEKISELKVRSYGNTAIATYKDTYDSMLRGEHRALTVIATDTFVKTGGEWKAVAGHASQAK
jgi:Tfp pilus assembly protein PilE